MRLALAVSAALLAAVLSSGPARADWPAARHDARRTAVASGKSDILKPTVAWRYYLGGNLSSNQLLAADVEGTGKNDFVLATPGTISAVRPDGSVVWQTRTSSDTFLLGIADLDGDGKQEIVAYTSLGALAIDLRTGAAAWRQPIGEMGTVSHVLLADMTGDGLPDLVVGECMSCAGGKNNQPGFIYSFAGGFSKPGRAPIPFPSIVAGPEATAVNMDGKGGAEIVAQVQSGQMLAVVDGTTAKILATGPNLATGNTGAYVSGCVPAKHPMDPGADVICVLSPSSDPSPSPTDASRVFALTFKAGPTPQLVQAWSVSFAPKEAISKSAFDLFVDLAGDGNHETLITGRDASGGYTVHILQATTGKELATVPGSLIGTAAALPGGARVIMTQGSATGIISLWSFAGGNAKSLGTIPGDGVAMSPDWPLLAVSLAGSSKPVALDANGDGLPDVFTSVEATGALLGFTPGKEVPAPQIGSLTFPTDTPLSGVWPLPPMDRPYAQLALLQADGTLHLMDKSFALTSTSLRAGGFYWSGGFQLLGTSPVVASLDGGPAQVLVVDRLRALLGLDATKATADTPPAVSFRSKDSFSPVVVQGLDGASAGVFALHRTEPSAAPPPYTLRRMRADGTVVWEVPVAAQPREDIIVGHFDGDSVPDVALQVSTSDVMVVITFAYSGVDGHTLWSTTVSGCPGRGGMSSFDWNGDGVDDVVQQGVPAPNGPTQVLSGVNGAQLAVGGPDDCFFLPMPYDINGDGKDELVFAGGLESEAVYAHDLTTKLYQSTEVDRPFPYATIAACPDEPTLVEGSSAFPSRLKFTKLGKSLGTSSTIFLVGGMLYHDQASANAAGGAQLTAVNLHDDLTGEGKPIAAVGSGDGWLYAVDPCSGELVFAYDFQAPVGEPVFGDTDGDGLDEIVVDVEDGYIYALRNTISTGTGGAGTGGTGTGGSGPWVYVNGRASCCGVAGSSPPGDPAVLVFAAGLLAVLARRRASRR